MTEERAREILREYRETDEETGQTYGLTVKRCLSAEGAQFVFLCALEGDPDQEVEYAVVKATEDVVVVPAQHHGKLNR